jgi:hypothetical protein
MVYSWGAILEVIHGTCRRLPHIPTGQRAGGRAGITIHAFRDFVSPSTPVTGHLGQCRLCCSCFSALPAVSSTPQVPFQIFDAIIIGAGAAGLFCAAQAGQQGLKCC